MRYVIQSELPDGDILSISLQQLASAKIVAAAMAAFYPTQVFAEQLVEVNFNGDGKVRPEDTVSG